MRKFSFVPTFAITSAILFFGCGEQPNPTELSLAELYANTVGVENNKGKIVFSTGDLFGPPGEIYVMNADGSGLKNLTNHEARDIQPTWSRNGQQIVFTSNREHLGVGPFPKQELYIMNADGSDVRRVIETTGLLEFNPHMSPNGQKIAFTRAVAPPPGFGLRNYVVNIDGSGLTNLTGDVQANDAFPRWSPNGQQILFNRGIGPGDADIYVMNADGSGKTNLTNTPGTRNDFFGTWSPNGKQIAFSAGLGTFPNLAAEDIYIMNSDGSGLSQLTTGPERDIAADWSPNGKQIVFHKEGEPSFIFTIDVDGNNEAQVTTQSGVFPGWASGPVK